VNVQVSGDGGDLLLRPGERSDDADGLAELLADAGIATPGELVALTRVVALSASTTALAWARGVPEGGAPVTAEDVVRTSWAEATWAAPVEPVDDGPG